MRRALLALLVLGTLSACAGGSDRGGGATGAGTSLTIVVTADEGVTPKTYELRCDPAGGDHPQPEQACAVLDSAGIEVFDPVGDDIACTEVYGGPQIAEVAGTYAGENVDATFNRTNGCEIDRWEQLGTTFFDVPLQ